MFDVLQPIDVGHGPTALPCRQLRGAPFAGVVHDGRFSEWRFSEWRSRMEVVHHLKLKERFCDV